MEEGLRQGCSLSPMLFAIYIKGLGDELVASGLGVKMGNTSIPGLFFADDMAILGENDMKLQELLNITGRYGRKWKIEFNPDKSKVVRIGQKSRDDVNWNLGQVELNEGKVYQVEIEEEKEFKYLGILFSSIGVFFSEVR